MNVKEWKEEIVKLFTMEIKDDATEPTPTPTDVKAQSVFKSVDNELRIVYGVVLEPGTFDQQGDITTEEEIFKAMHDYMVKHQTINLQHTPVEVDTIIVENFIAPTDMDINGEAVVKGAWVMGVKVLNDVVWKAIEEGTFTGYSIEGRGMRTPIDE
jgi:hypothetical protein